MSTTPRQNDKAHRHRGVFAVVRDPQAADLHHAACIAHPDPQRSAVRLSEIGIFDPYTNRSGMPSHFCTGVPEHSIQRLASRLTRNQMSCIVDPTPSSDHRPTKEEVVHRQEEGPDHRELAEVLHRETARSGGLESDRREFLLRSAKAFGGIALVSGFAPVLASCGGSEAGEAPAGQALYLAPGAPFGLDADGQAATDNISNVAMDGLFRKLLTWEVVENDEGVNVPDLTRLKGELAESWEQNGLKWTFKLREGVMSAVGNELTADDVVWTFARAKWVKDAPVPAGWFVLNVASVMPDDVFEKGADLDLAGEIRKIDKYTVEITQMKPNRLFPAVLTVHVIAVNDSVELKKHATRDDPFAHKWLNMGGTGGFGPYKLKSWTRDSEMVLEANPTWTDPDLPRPLIKTWTIRKTPSSSTRLQSLLRGAADVTTDLNSNEFDFARTEGEGDLQVLGVYGSTVTFLGMNFKVAPFENVRLRQAIAYAIPYDAIIEAGYLGEAKRWFGCVPSSFPGYKEVKKYDTDPSKARELLRAAGFPEGEGLAKFEDSFQLSYRAETQSQIQPIAELIQTSLREIGLPVELNPTPQADFATRQLVERDLPFALEDTHKAIVGEAGYHIQLFFVSVERGGIVNPTNYSNREIDDIWIMRAKNEPDDAKRRELMGQIQDIAMEEVAWLPICEYKLQTVLRTDVEGYVWYPNNSLQIAELQKEA